MKAKTGPAREAKEAEAKRKAELDERLTREARDVSERIRAGFEADRQALARRYGGLSLPTSDVDKG